MKGIKKILLLCLCIAALATASVFGTMAYLTDTDVAVNTFTVGKVNITVDESKVNPDGTMAVDLETERVKANEYHLIPGMTYLKDPTVTLLAGSESAYIRMIVTVHNAENVPAQAPEDFAAFIDGWDEEVWLYKGYCEDEDKGTISFEFRYKEVVPGDESDTTLAPLFDKLIVPGEITGEQMEALLNGGFKLEIFGHAIQATGFTDRTDAATGTAISAEDTAWEAFDQQLADRKALSP